MHRVSNAECNKSMKFEIKILYLPIQKRKKKVHNYVTNKDSISQIFRDELKIIFCMKQSYVYERFWGILTQNWYVRLLIYSYSDPTISEIYSIDHMYTNNQIISHYRRTYNYTYIYKGVYSYGWLSYKCMVRLHMVYTLCVSTNKPLFYIYEFFLFCVW